MRREEPEMSTRMRDLPTGGLGELRHEPTAKRIRAVLDGGTVVDTTRALLVWGPRRIVPSYAVPAEDIAAELAPADTAATDAAGTVGAHMPELSGRPVLDPSVPFAVHSAEGRPADLRASEQDRPGAGFYPTDPDLARYVVLDFGAFDAWCEEDERNVAHPRDRSTASTSSLVRVTSVWNWTATCWRSLPGLRCCLRPCSHPLLPATRRHPRRAHTQQH